MIDSNCSLRELSEQFKSIFALLIGYYTVWAVLGLLGDNNILGTFIYFYLVLFLPIGYSLLYNPYRLPVDTYQHD